MARAYNSDLIKNFTQIRLCVVLINKNNGKPLAKMPLFAEINANFDSLPDTAPDYIFDNKYKEVLGKYSTKEIEAIKEAIIYVVSRYVDSSYYDKSDNDKNNQLNDIILKIISDLKSKSEEILKDFSKVNEFIKECLLDILKANEIETHDLLIQNRLTFPLGFLATDHVGYISYDISNALKTLKTNHLDGELNVEYLIYPYGLEKNKINVIPQKRYTKDVVFSKIEIENLLHYDDMHTAYNYQSMQNPSLIDWYLSPSSFSVNPSYFIGQDGCENLFPANFATQEFRFFQIVRGKEITETVNITGRGNVQASKNPKIRIGWSLEYLTTWQPLGHTLGQIIYSLPLAPGETVKIAIIDWARKSRDSRDEDLTVKEQLDHNTHRDRTISETVEAALHEWQRGGSIMGGNSGGAGVAGSYGTLGYAAGNAHSFGGGYSTSSGDRNVTASTVQQASDAFAQHSSSLRELRSTIVVQSNQEEHAKAETRVIANHNHSHALTMLYYEVLRHYKVTTEFIRLRNSLMIDYSNEKNDFKDENQIIKYRKILENVLIDERYLECFNAVQKYLCAKNEVDFQYKKKEIIDQGNIEFDEYRLTFLTGDDAFDIDDDVLFDLHTTMGINRCKDIDSNDTKLHRDFNQGSTEIINVTSNSKLKWSQINRFQISVQSHGDESWWLERFSLEGKDKGGIYYTLYSDRIGAELEDDGDQPYIIRDIIKPILAEKMPEPLDKLSEEERCCLNKLKKHLDDNQLYYNNAVWLLEDPNERANRFEKIAFEGKTLLDYIDNRPLDVLGDYVVFPSNFISDEQIPFNVEKIKIEKLMTMPTRGVFAESKLGHCNASEIIDNTRFWDWQQSPITEQAPDINPVSTDSRNVTQNLTPSQLPNSIVNIVNPSNLPDPTGLSSALNLLGKSDLFRDMSMSKEVNDLLKKLSDNSVSFAEAANKAREILANENIAKTKADAEVQTAAQNAKASKEPNLTPQQFMDWMNAAKNAPMSPQDKKDVIQDVKEAAKASVNPKSTGQSASSTKKLMIFRMHTQSDQLLHVTGTWDFEVHHDGITDFEKLSFFDGIAQYNKSKITSDGAVVLKGEGQISASLDRGLFTKIPGLPPPSGKFQFAGNGSFKYDKTMSSISFDVLASTKKFTAEVFTEAGGNASVKYSANVEANIEIVKISAGPELNAEINGKLGTKINYEVEYLTGGLSITQKS